MARKELEGKEIPFQSIARSTGDDQVAGIVEPTTRQRHDVIERRRSLIEMRRTVYAPLPAVAKGRPPHRAFERRVHDAIGAHRHEMSRPRPFRGDLAAASADGGAFGGASAAGNTAAREAKVGVSRHQHDPPP
jgi:hypothetical protein